MGQPFDPDAAMRTDAPSTWPTGRLLATAGRLVEHAFNAALAHVGVTTAGLLALYALGGGPLSQRELAQRCQVENQTIGRTVERLQRSGYVSRERDPRDRRRMVVTRTAAGDAAWARFTADDFGVDRVFAELEHPQLLHDQLVTVVERLMDGRWPGGGAAPGVRSEP